MNRRVLLVIGLLILAVVAAVSIPQPARAHTRITTDVTWSEHIREIFIQKCMTCHHPGGTAPDYVDLTVYGTDTNPGARAWSIAIQEEILLNRMPPWQPDKRFGHFENTQELTAEEIEIISAWVSGGSPQGPFRNLPVPEQFARPDWSFGQPDLVFGLPQGHVVPADQQTDETNIILPIEIEEDTYVTGYEFLVENPKNIFRMTAYLLDPEGVDIPAIEVEVQQEYDPLADEDEAEVVRMREMPAGPHFIGQWVRGDGPVLFPDAAGHILRKGSSLQLHIEYLRPDFADWSEEIRDNSKVGLFIAQPDEEIDLLVETKSMGNSNFVIKAEAAAQEVKAEMTMVENVHLIGINPYMGPLGSSLEVKVNYPDGFSRTLMWIPEYKKRWTASYRFEEPIAAPVGTRLELIARFNNTEDNWDNPNSPPVDVKAGTGAGDESLRAMISYMLDDHLNIEEVFVPPERPQAESGGGMLIRGASPFSNDPDSTEMGIVVVQTGLAKAPEPEEESPIKLSKNNYHRVEALMEKPGEVQIFVYDDKLIPLGPKNFSGELIVAGDGVPLVVQRPGDDHLTSWVSPGLPVSFETKLALAGTEETFAFTIDELTKRGGSDSGKRDFKPAPHGGWIFTVDDDEHRIEATLEEPGDLRVYFYDDDLNAIDPRNFLGGHAIPTGNTAGKPEPLDYPSRGAEYLSATMPNAVPLSVDVSVWFGADKKKFRFDFDELTEEPWDDWGGDAPVDLPLIAGPHGSPEIFAASNGFHFVEGTMPRPGEFRLYFYDEWRNPVDPRLFHGAIYQDGEQLDLEHYAADDAYLSAFLDPVFPVRLSSKILITGNEDRFDFSFDSPTIDPADLVPVDTHMDHTPMHGGFFFMADNMFHHVEGTMPKPGEFRVYFYNDFKRPIDPRSFSGTTFIEQIDAETGEVAEDAFELFYARPRDQFLTAVLPAKMPMTLYTIVSLGGEDKRYDFEFDTLSVEPVRSSIASVAGGDTSGSHEHIRPPFPMPPTIEGLIAGIADREADLLVRLRARDWNTLFIPAFDTRDMVAELAKKDAGFTARQHGRLRTLVGAINRSIGKIEGTAHSNDPPRVQKAYDDYAAGVSDLRELYASFLQ